MTPANAPQDRRGMRHATQRDFDRHARKDEHHRQFWRSLSMLGMVGWPIALLSVGGALLGRYLDNRFQSGVQFTLTLLTVGVTIGSIVAWRALQSRME